MLARGVPQFHIAPRHIRDGQRRDHRLVGDVLQSLQFQPDLNLRLRRDGDEKDEREENDSLHGAEDTATRAR